MTAIVRRVVPTLQFTLLAVLASCSDPSGPPGPPGVASVDLGAASLRLAVGQALVLPIEIRNSTGQVLSNRRAEWWSSDTTVVSISGSGTLTARGAGSAAVTATVDTTVAQVDVTVHVEGLHAWPDTMALLPDGTGQLAARALLPGGSPVLLSAATWESSNPEVVTVDSGGVVTAVAAGHATITASAGEARMHSQLFVVDHPQPIRFVSLSAGENQTCGVTADGEAYCWGMGWWPAFGTDAPTTRCEYLWPNSYTSVNRVTHRCSSFPIRVGGGLRFTSVSVGFAHACGIVPPAAVYCWGSNEHGAVDGVPSEGEVTLPTRVGADIEFRSVSAGGSATCGVSTQNQAYCWGDNRAGLLGSGSWTPVAGPTPLTGGLSLETVEVGWAHACGVTLDGEVYCWGRNAYGELGVEGAPESCDGTTLECSTKPVRVATPQEFDTIGAGTFFTCGLTVDAGAYCWGSGFHGKLGNGREEHSRTPVAVQGSSAFVDLSVGGNMACALDPEGSSFCWGNSVLHATGELPVTTSIPTRSAPEAALQSIDVGWGLCGIRSDGIAVCRGGTTVRIVPGQ